MCEIPTHTCTHACFFFLPDYMKISRLLEPRKFREPSLFNFPPVLGLNDSKLSEKKTDLLSDPNNTLELEAVSECLVDI